MEPTVFSHGTPQNLRLNTFNREGHVFIGWSRTAFGPAEFADGQSTANLTTNTTETIVLYAQWSTGEISSLAITVSTPVFGDMRNTTLTNNVLGFYTASAVVWSPGDGMFFTAGERYTATVTLTAISGFSFSNNFSGTINGFNSSVTNNTGNQVTLSYRFQSTAVREYWVDFPELGSTANRTLTDGSEYQVSETTLINAEQGQNGLIINGEVTIYIHPGVRLTVTGGAGVNGVNGHHLPAGGGTGGSGAEGGNAAILLEAGNRLIIRGGGTLDVTGGRGGNAGNGGNAVNSSPSVSGQGAGGGGGAGG
jgi:uncharacterized repeat protein (TIGR02543 family)